MGGLYGVTIGGVFFGESMFSFVTNASKFALFHLIERLKVAKFDFTEGSQSRTAHGLRVGFNIDDLLLSGKLGGNTHVKWPM